MRVLMIKTVPVLVLGVLGLAVLTSFTLESSVSALSIMEGVNAARGNGQPASLFGAGGVITTITNTLLFLVGALSVIMIIYGGIRYTTSASNSASVATAKNTILYAVVGLVVAFLAFAAVNFILGSISAGGQAGFTNT